jgi:hypothetical protein
MFGWLRNLLGLNPPETGEEYPEDWVQLHSDPHFDPIRLRLNYPASKLKGMPVKTITTEQEFELRMDWTFTIVEMYDDLVDIFPGEVGHDQNYRYVVSKLAPQGEHAL